MSQDIVLTVDYHDKNCVIRRFDRRDGAERLQTVPTTAPALSQVVDEALKETQTRGSQVVWLQESTTGWARVEKLLGPRVQFLLANVVQMPLPPKGRRRKTDKVDTARLQREYLIGTLPLAHQPPAAWRQLRRLTALRENLRARQTALSNWINRYLAHETWFARDDLATVKGRKQLEKLELPPADKWIISLKTEELKLLREQFVKVEAAMHKEYLATPAAQRVDAIKGIGSISALAIVARIGPIARFRNAEHLIAYAGLAPGVRQSDQTRHDGRIGGGGTDKQLRHYLIEATIWARKISRYAATYERVRRRRGRKIGRLVVARLLLRSIYKMLRDGVAFQEEDPRRKKEELQREKERPASTP